MMKGVGKFKPTLFLCDAIEIHVGLKIGLTITNDHKIKNQSDTIALILTKKPDD